MFFQRTRIPKFVGPPGKKLKEQRQKEKHEEYLKSRKERGALDPDYSAHNVFLKYWANITTDPRIPENTWMGLAKVKW